MPDLDEYTDAMKSSAVYLRIGMHVAIVVFIVSCAGSPEVVERPPSSADSTEVPTAAADGSTDAPPTRDDEETVELAETEFSQESITEEFYDQTFSEVESTIAELNQIIAEESFDRWRSFLTTSYRNTFSDPRVLEENSQSAVLQNRNITLRSLEDYFRFVVVPSRANVRLDDIVFINESTVEAIMVIQGERYLIYNLTKSNDRWKIDTF